MSRTDPSAATGVVPREPLRCACGCLEPLHAFNERTWKRTSCSSSTCDCKQFAAEGGGAP